MNNVDVPARTTEFDWLLAIDTSTEQIGLALTDGERMIELSLPGGRQQTTSMLPLIDWLISKQELSIADIQVVAVAIGPGSFTGLRVGLSIAKGLALAQDAKVVGIPTLDIVAWSYRQSRIPLIAVIPAGRSRFVWSLVDAAGKSVPPVNGSLDELVSGSTTNRDHLVVGELPFSVHSTLVEQGAWIESHGLGNRRNAALAAFGWSRYSLGDVDDPALLEPIYLHGKQTALPPRSQR